MNICGNDAFQNSKNVMMTYEICHFFVLDPIFQIMLHYGGQNDQIFS